MATGKITGTFIREGVLHVHAEVSGDAISPVNGAPINREYSALIPMSELAGLTTVQARALVISYLKRERDKFRDPGGVLPSLPATLTIPD